MQRKFTTSLTHRIKINIVKSVVEQTPQYTHRTEQYSKRATFEKKNLYKMFLFDIEVFCFEAVQVFNSDSSQYLFLL